MVSEAVSGGEQRDPDVQAETETNSGSKWGQNYRKERCSTSVQEDPLTLSLFWENDCCQL